MALEASKRSVAGAAPARVFSEPVGFSSEIDGASLWELVQTECLGGARTAVRVRSDSGQTGLLFFDARRVVHAQVPRAVGESAALEMFTWPSGVFEPCDADWPSVPTISKSPEMLHLLLRAGQTRDDGTGAASNLVAFPRPASAEVALAGGGARVGSVASGDESETDWAGLPFDDDQDWEMEVTRPSGPPFGSSPPSEGSSRAPEGGGGGSGGSHEITLPIAVHVAPDGAILESVDEQLADAVAYAGRLATLIGELLGLDGFRALECASKDERLIMYTDQDGGLAAGRVPIATEVGPLRERLGL